MTSFISGASRTIAITSMLLCTLFLTACATKHYGRQGALTNYERSQLTCKEINTEIAKVNGFLQTVDEESGFDARSVLSFATDFGIGNVMEKRSAVKSAKTRLKALRELSAIRSCTTSPDH